MSSLLKHLTNRVAVVNQSEAMEADTISKNGRNPKSLKSKRNFLRKAGFALLTMGVIFNGCSGGGSSGKIKITTEKDGIVFYLCGSGTATVNWGDGSEKVTLTLKDGDMYTYLWSAGVDFSHRYTSASIRTITVNGDHITGLYCKAYLTDLDVRCCTELTELYLHCGLTSLDVSKNVALTKLDCSDNQLKSLNVSKNRALTYLSLYNNNFTADALNALFETLHSNEWTKGIVLKGSGNPGLNTCDRSIAERKGWIFY